MKNQHVKEKTLPWKGGKTPQQRRHVQKNNYAKKTITMSKWLSPGLWRSNWYRLPLQLLPAIHRWTHCQPGHPRCLTRSLTAIGRLWRGWLGQVTLEPAWSFQIHYYALIPMKLWFLWGVMFHRWVITAPGRIFQKMSDFSNITSFIVMSMNVCWQT